MTNLNDTFKKVGVVIIGRNEGQRLMNCLHSLQRFMAQVVYVDSASSDDSVKDAKALGAHVVSLDMSKPFTAARARNVGFDAIMTQHPALEYVQFVDGDCKVADTWIDIAVNFLDENQQVAVVCGRRKEIAPNSSIYNRMCDAEWDTPIGLAKTCGGDALFRVNVYRQVGGFRYGLIAGEEPELCVRIRQNGFKIWRLDAEMTFHDAAIYYFSQWWRRTMRGGYAFAAGANLHGSPPESHWVVESRRAWLWGAIIPITIIIACCIKPRFAYLGFIYPVQLLRLTYKSPLPFIPALQESFFLIFGKFAELFGQIKFLVAHYRHQQSHIIEYK